MVVAGVGVGSERRSLWILGWAGIFQEEAKLGRVAVCAWVLVAADLSEVAGFEHDEEVAEQIM